jgi:IclR family acetate operon transcriptional repressor
VRATDGVDRVVTVLELLAEAPDGLRVTDVAHALDVHKATASRLLATLSTRRVLDRDGSGRYRLGPAFLRFAASALTGLEMVSQARPDLEVLSRRTGETVNLAILDGAEVVYVDQVTGDHAIVAGNWVGRRSPAHCSSSGKVLLAFGDDATRERVLAGPLERRTSHTVTDPRRLRSLLDEVRRRGYARSVAELEDGLTTVAAPVVTRGELVAAVSVSGPSFRLPAGDLPQLGQLTVDAALTIGRRLMGETIR